MTNDTDDKSDTLAEAVEVIESSYEFMLAYAAQGRDFESRGGDGPAIRQTLTDLNKALEHLAYAFAEKIGAFGEGSPARQALDEFKNVLAADADKARKAIRVILSLPSISSQSIDNLNASAHLRTLLTDLFLLDEAIRLHHRDAGGTEKS